MKLEYFGTCRPIPRLLDISGCMNYRQTSNISRAQFLKLKCFSSLLTVVFAQSFEASSLVGNKDVIGAAPTGDDSTTSEWSIILLPNKVRLILEV